MDTEQLTIAVILDPEFGQRLVELAAHGPVWMTGSPTNQAAARDYWNSAPPERHDVTFWSEERTGATEEEWLSILDDLELHHSEDWAGPGISGIQVFGAPPTPAARAALREFGYSVTKIGPNGFEALKRAKPN
jgi:hypothetical protein